MSTSNATGHNTAATPQSKIVAVPAVARRYARKPAIQRITSNGTIAAAAMVLAAIVAVIVANTDAYFAVREFLEAPLAVQVGPFIGSISLEGFINDFLMAIFFLSVGIELKYELTAGVLTNPRHALMPILAACGGVAVPALIYSAFNAGGNIGGWAVPIATDIAFALGIMSLAGDKVAPAAKVFFSTLAIADDLLGIIVIALFYGQTPSIPWLAAAVGVCVLLGLLNVLQVFHARYYVVLGILLWFCMLNSGVHATLAGVILAFFLPARSDIRLDSVKDWLSDRGDELVRFLVGDIVGAVVDHHGVLDVVGVRERHEIAAVRHILRRERDAHAGRFKRRSAGIIDLRIVAENGEVRRVAARGHAGRDGAREAKFPLRRQKVHARVPGKLERRMTAERGERLVSHTVAEKYHMLHIISPASFSRIRAFRLY